MATLILHTGICSLPSCRQQKAEKRLPHRLPDLCRPCRLLADPFQLVLLLLLLPKEACALCLISHPLEEGDDYGTVGRHDNVSLIRSSPNHDMKRLKNAQILRLMQHNELTLVIPPADYKQSKSSIQPQKDLMHKFFWVILSASARKMNTKEKD